MTSRTKKYGNPGDVLQSHVGMRLRLVSVRQAKVGYVARTHFREEGCRSPDEFVRVWTELHPRRGWNPNEVVWVHEFEVVT